VVAREDFTWNVSWEEFVEKAWKVLGLSREVRTNRDEIEMAVRNKVKPIVQRESHDWGEAIETITEMLVRAVVDGVAEARRMSE